MSERVFPSGDWPADDAHATVCGADLAELVLDEISGRHHDWPTISRYTEALHELTSAMAALYPSAGDAKSAD